MDPLALWRSHLFFALANPRKSGEGHVEGTGPDVSPLTEAPSLRRSGGGDGGPMCCHSIPPHHALPQLQPPAQPLCWC